jgi:hypothetical protein
MDKSRPALNKRVALTPYLLLFAFFAIGALLSEPQLLRTATGVANPQLADEAPTEAGTIPLALMIGGIMMAVMIGTRFRVGGNGDTYIFYWGYAAVQLGLVRFARTPPLPRLTIVVAPRIS